jgi:hypothetical protein
MPTLTQPLTIDGACLLVVVTAPKSSSPANSLSVEGLAQIDTGAEWTAVDIGIIGQLGIQPKRSVGIDTPSGGGTRTTYSVRLEFVDFPRNINCSEVIATKIQSHNGNVIVLLGRDFLENFVFTYDGQLKVMTISCKQTQREGVST